MDLVRLDLLEAVQPALLVRFLRPFAAYLGGCGVLLEHTCFDGAWLERLHRTLNAVDPEMPPDLQQGLLDIADLTSESAHEQVLSIAHQQQLSLFKLNARTTPEELAFAIYLDHRDLFRTVHARAQSSEVRRFVELVGKDAAPPVSLGSGGRRALLAQRLGTWFRERNRTAFCDVRVVETEEEVRFLVIHGRPPRSHGAIESDERRGRISYVPDQHDLLVFDRRTGRLAIHAQFPREQDLYRRALGAVYWDDEEHFEAAPLFSGQPLSDLGSAAVEPQGVPGVAAVALRSITVASEAVAGEAITWVGANVAANLDSGVGRLVRQFGVVTAFRLDVGLTGRQRPVRVDVRVPNHISFDRRVGADVIHEFLLEAGFMRLPEATRVAS